MDRNSDGLISMRELRAFFSVMKFVNGTGVTSLGQGVGLAGVTKALEIGFAKEHFTCERNEAINPVTLLGVTSGPAIPCHECRACGLHHGGIPTLTLILTMSDSSPNRSRTT
jgi:hypothetical protein